MFKPSKIPVNTLKGWKNNPVVQIDGFHLINVKIPSSLNKKKTPFEDESLQTTVRGILNTLNADNIVLVEKSLRDVIMIQVKNVNDLKCVAIEMLGNIVILDKNIPIYIELIDSVYNMCIEEPNDFVTLGNLFLIECRDMFFSVTSMDASVSMAKLDHENPDEMDVYIRKYDKIVNLLLLFCILYNNRNDEKIRIENKHMLFILTHLFEQYNECQSIMTSIGNPYENDLSPEHESTYLLYEKVSLLYTKYIYTIMNCHWKTFIGTHLNDLGNEFIKTIVPNITDPFLIEQCKVFN